MAPSDSEASLASDNPSPPNDDYEDYSTGDEYRSDGSSLADNDLNVLNEDYARQRDLTFLESTNFLRSRENFVQSNPPNPTRRRSQNERYRPPLQAWNMRKPVPLSRGKKQIYNGSLYCGRPSPDAYAYPDTHDRRPLVDYIKNEWRNLDESPTSLDEWSWPLVIQVLLWPRFQRSVLTMLAISFLIWGNWKTWAGPRYSENVVLSESLRERMRTGDGWFGQNMRPEFMDMVHLQTLDQRLLPQKGDKDRLIVIGDVHGCMDELNDLLSQTQYNATTDHLIFTGDLISKGPSSSAVLDLAIEASASCVRGDHEDRLLLAYRDMSAHRIPLKSSSSSSSTDKDTLPPAPGAPASQKQKEILDEESFEHGDVAERRLARQLTKKQIDYIASCPVVLDIGEIDTMGAVRVVHAGLVPGTTLDHQDPVGVMHMRTIDPVTHVPSSSGKGLAWFKLWNKYQSLLPPANRSTVIYGHDSRRGLQLEAWSKGIDSGCVKGGKLTALVVKSGKEGLEEVGGRVISVECKDHRGLEEKRGEGRER